MCNRTNPVPNRRVKLVSKWSGVLTADSDVKLRYRVRVPQFSGALSIMAVAYKDDAFGSAEFTMKVADPVVISTALPRFMSPGDTVGVVVTLTNTTNKIIKGMGNLSVHTQGGFAMRFIPGPYAKTNALSEYADSPIIELPPRLHPDPARQPARLPRAAAHQIRGRNRRQARPRRLVLLPYPRRRPRAQRPRQHRPQQPANPRHRPSAQPSDEISRLAQHPGARVRPAGPRQNSPPKRPQHRPPPRSCSTANRLEISMAKT